MTAPTKHRPSTPATTAKTSIVDRVRHGSGADRAYLLLRMVFVIAPILFGVDKFLGVLTNWDQYLAPWIDSIVPGTAHQAMYAVGVIEIVAGVAVAVIPRYGALVVAAWLLGIIVDLVSTGQWFDVALRDFGLFVAALALAALAFDRRRAHRAP